MVYELAVESTIRKATSNVRERITASLDLIEREIGTLRRSVDHLLRLEPAKAGTEVVAGTVKNLADFVERQAEILRRWLR